MFVNLTFGRGFQGDRDVRFRVESLGIRNRDARRNALGGALHATCGLALSGLRIWVNRGRIFSGCTNGFGGQRGHGLGVVGLGCRFSNIVT